jgi:hypothetical protein
VGVVAVWDCVVVVAGAVDGVETEAVSSAAIAVVLIGMISNATLLTSVE